MSSDSRRRARIRKKITEKRRVQRNCQQLKQKLKREKDLMDRSVGEWQRHYQVFNGYQITSQVIIPHLYEGVCAQQTERELPPAIALMEETKRQNEQVTEQLVRQIWRLDEYIERLEREIDVLYNQL